jgi:hypothetical protein
MRLFLVGVLAVWGAFGSGCSKGDDLKAGALRVTIRYDGFRPGCVTLEATDLEDASKQAVTPVAVTAGTREGALTVAVFRQQGWSRRVRLTAVAHEVNCEGAVALEARAEQEIPAKGVSEPVELVLSGEDVDDDGYLSTASGGTDCDDREAGVGGPKPWYVDEDNDGYGSDVLGLMAPSCQYAGIGKASRGGDCDDSDRNIYPGREEFRCDEKDDNCNGQVDEVFDVGTTCVTGQQCPGTRQCNTSGSSSECVSAEVAKPYYFDEDNDGKAGTLGGMTCGTPPPNSKPQSEDCDESSRFVANGLPEVCDRLDNDCAGGVDNGLNCNWNWEGSSGGPGGRSRWNTIAVGKNVAWLAGANGSLKSGNIMKVLPDRTTTQSTCDADASWSSAWVSDSGELFLGGPDGKVARKALSQTDCTRLTTGANAEVTGIVGFDSLSGGNPILYLVTSSGVIFRWAPPQPPEELVKTSINLRAIHGTSAEGPLWVVGTRDYGVPALQPVAIRLDPSSKAFDVENFPDTAPKVYMRGVHVLTQNFIYAVGDDGAFLKRERGTWTHLSPPGPNVNVTDVLALGKTAIYVTTAPKPLTTGVQGAIHFFNGESWSATPFTSASAIRSIDGPTPTRMGASGDDGVYQFFYRP